MRHADDRTLPIHLRPQGIKRILEYIANVLCIARSWRGRESLWQATCSFLWSFCKFFYVADDEPVG